MKAVLSWLCDPYLHMFLVALVVLRLSTGAGGGEPNAGASMSRPDCVLCLGHDEDAICNHLFASAFETVR